MERPRGGSSPTLLRKGTRELTILSAGKVKGSPAATALHTLSFDAFTFIHISIIWLENKNDNRFNYIWELLISTMDFALLPALENVLFFLLIWQADILQVQKQTIDIIWWRCSSCIVQSTVDTNSARWFEHHFFRIRQYVHIHTLTHRHTH